MFRVIRLVVRIAFIMFLMLIVFACFTNPDIEEFKAEVRKQLNSKVEAETDSPSLDYIAQLGEEFTDQVVEKLVTRKNYFVCSVFSVSLPDGDYVYLGAFHMFYPFQEKNPLDSF